MSQLTGIIYLENNLATGVFTSDRLDIINILSAQAAISIENGTAPEESGGPGSGSALCHIGR